MGATSSPRRGTDSAPRRMCVLHNWTRDICFVTDSVSDTAPETGPDLSSTATIDLNDGCLRNDGCFRRHHVEPRVKLYTPIEESIPIPLKCINERYWSNTHHLTQRWKNKLKRIGTWMEKNCQMYVKDSQDLFYRTKGPLKDFQGWREVDEETNNLKVRQDNAWPDMWKHVSDAAKSKAKQKWTIEKPKPDNARQLRGIFFIEQNIEEFQFTMKAVAMVCKILIKQWKNPPQC